MPVPPGKVPIVESARAGLAFVRANFGPIAAAAAIVALPVAALNAMAQLAAAQSVLVAFALQIAAAAAGAAFTAAALRGALSGGDGAVAVRLSADEARLLGAMAVVGFFLFIVLIVAALPGAIALAVVAAPYEAELQAAAGDPQASFEATRRVLEAEWPQITLIFLVYAFVWLALTSRLYLVAPATVAEGRVLTFETWRWTDGNMLRIIAARLALLVPAFAVMSALQIPAAALLSQLGEGPAGLLALGLAQFWSAFVALGLYYAAEAGLSAYLYRGLRPAG